LRAGPFVIFARADHEFYFVVVRKLLDVLIPVAFHHAGGRRLEIDDPFDLSIDARNIDVPPVSIMTS